ncbi:hypothetical protein Pfo_008559 [Paulownia fortunei]|nr:hypothetical protein Pfo_008559 [Paulownia fortunei]
MAMRSDLKNEPQSGDSVSSVFPVKHEAIRTTSLASSDPIDALSYINMPENQVFSNEDDFFLYQLDDTLVGLEPKFTGFWNGNVSKNDSSFYPHNIPQTCDSVHTPDCFLVGKGFEMELSLPRTCSKLARCHESHVQSLQHSLGGKKRKMASDDASQLTPSENVSDTQEENELTEKQDEEENLELEHKSAAKSSSTIVGEERIHKSNSGAAQSGIVLPKFSAEAPEEDHVQMRAKRGQAISRHSLAERIRRERISERMKFLQGLVPGCDKITGKAVMLDEIINYVLSLQHQIEFLSMKLAAVDPGETCQTDPRLSKDVYHSQGVIATRVTNHEVSYFHCLPNNYASTSSSNGKLWQEKQAGNSKVRIVSKSDAEVLQSNDSRNLDK